MFGFFSSAGSDRKQASAAPQTQSLKLEALEDRTALSTLNVYDGKLWIGGTNAADTIQVEEVAVWNGWGYNTRYTVYENGWATANFWASQLYNRDIIFSGYGGNDTFVNNTGLNLWAYGGNGSDRLYGGWGSDRLFGEGQDDYVDGRWGDDWLNGGWGNGWTDGVADVVVGGSGFDRVYIPPGWDAMDTIYSCEAQW